MDFIIYSIENERTNEIYIGSTIKKNLKYRLTEHKSDFKRFQENRFHYISSFKLFENNDPCHIRELYFGKGNKQEKLEKEKEYIKNFANHRNIVNILMR